MSPHDDAGRKFILLLQILALAEMNGDKTVVFSQCLKTLNYIEKVLNTPNWENLVPGLTSLSPGRVWGPWRKNAEYLRIDGAIKATERGELITSFNDDNNNTAVPEGATKQNVENSKLFLISTLAGGIGINLVAANRVVMFDSHWNPARDLQALYRCYRYGQTKRVFSYRLLTEGTMEEKIYSRCVNKCGLAARVVDLKYPERMFDSNDLSLIRQTDTWVACDRCDKWRMLPLEAADAEHLPDKWFCEMNTHDKDRSNCAAKERDAKWYSAYFARKRQSAEGCANGEAPQGRESIASCTELNDSTTSKAKDAEAIKDSFTKQDPVLQHLLTLSTRKSKDEDCSSMTESRRTQTSLISTYHFHDALVEESSEKKEPGFIDLDKVVEGTLDVGSLNKSNIELMDCSGVSEERTPQNIDGKSAAETGCMNLDQVGVEFALDVDSLNKSNLELKDCAGVSEERTPQNIDGKPMALSETEARNGKKDSALQTSKQIPDASPQLKATSLAIDSVDTDSLAAKAHISSSTPNKEPITPEKKDRDSAQKVLSLSPKKTNKSGSQRTIVGRLEGARKKLRRLKEVISEAEPKSQAPQTAKPITRKGNRKEGEQERVCRRTSKRSLVQRQKLSNDLPRRKPAKMEIIQIDDSSSESE
jgi:hypothetical protein